MILIIFIVGIVALSLWELLYEEIIFPIIYSNDMETYLLEEKEQ